jgi:hypothetical protein
MEYGSGRAPLRFAVGAGDLNSLAVLLECTPYRANPNREFRYIGKPFETAFECGNLPCATMLLIYQVLSRKDRESYLRILPDSLEEKNRVMATDLITDVRRSSLTDDNLICQLIKIASTPETSLALEIAMAKALEGSANPYHLAVQARQP